ncbi:hypothetical protein MASR2M18_02900 [Ignavibacteria bacterium]|jgi:hypothetical protein|nr:hypothetical protein [Bacteroidota bacterium]MCZ2132229.1 hypothetical protein [Bacteroidota bacterium]
MKNFLIAAASAAALFFCSSEAVSQVQFLNNSSDMLFAEITVKHNGKILVKGLKYRRATPFMASDIDGFDTLTIISEADTNIKRTLPVAVDGSAPMCIIIQGVGEPFAFAANPDGRDISLSAYCQNVNIKSEEPTETEILFQFGSTDAPICSLNAVDIAPLIRKGSFGDATPFPIPMPAMRYEFAIIEESGIPSIHSVFKVDLSDWGGKTGICALSGFWNPKYNNSDKSLVLLLVNSNGEAKEYLSEPVGIYSEINSDVERPKFNFYAAIERVVWDSPEIVSAKIFSESGVIAAHAADNSVTTVNLPNGVYFCTAENRAGNIFIERVLICR